MQGDLALIVAAAVVPAVAWAIGVAWLAALPRALWLGAAIAFAWGGAVAPALASALNDLAGASLGDGAAARWLLPVVLAPTIEETTKATGFVALALVAGSLVRSAHGAIAAGALLGLGFAAAENVGYYTVAAVQAGYPGLARAVYLRGVVESANHPAFTALAGAGIGLSTLAGEHRRRLVLAFAGLGAAIAFHAVWNGVVSREITTLLCNAPVDDGACAPAPGLHDLLLGAPVLEALFLTPMLAALGVIALREP